MFRNRCGSTAFHMNHIRRCWRMVSEEAGVSAPDSVTTSYIQVSELSVRIGKIVEWSGVELNRQIWAWRFSVLCGVLCVFYFKCAVAMAGESGKLQVFWDPHSQPSRAVVIFCRWVKHHLANHIAKQGSVEVLWGKVEDDLHIKKKKFQMMLCMLCVVGCRINKIEYEEVHISLPTGAHKTPEYLSKWWWWMNLLIDFEVYL